MTQYVITITRLGPFSEGRRVSEKELTDAGIDIDHMLERAAIGVEYAVEPTEQSSGPPGAAAPEIIVPPPVFNVTGAPEVSPEALPTAAGTPVELAEIKMGASSEPMPSFAKAEPPPLNLNINPLPPLGEVKVKPAKKSGADEKKTDE